MHHSLLAAKAWLAKKGHTVPRLELISAHMAANIVDNVRGALDEYVVWFVYASKGSTVVLYWIAGQGALNNFCPIEVTH